MTYWIGRSRHKNDRCSCYRPATCRRWEEVDHGPGGGIDIVWGVVPSCAECAAKTFEKYKPFAHILPPGMRFEDMHLTEKEGTTREKTRAEIEDYRRSRRPDFEGDLRLAKVQLELIHVENSCSDWRCRFCGSEVRGTHSSTECYDRAWCAKQAKLVNPT